MGHAGKGTGEPLEHIFEIEPLQYERLAAGNLVEGVQVSTFDPDAEKRHLLCLFGGLDPLRRHLPDRAVGGAAIGDEKNLGPVIGYPLLPVDILALFELVQRQVDGRPQWRVVVCLELWSSELVRRN